MTGFLLAFLACLALMVPGRDAVRVAGLAEQLGPGAGLLVAVWLSTVASNALAAWLTTLLAPTMPPAARQMFLAFALVLGAAELVLRRMPSVPQEPTRSTGAMLLVLLVSQMTDGARLLVMAVALYTAQPATAAAGGFLASVAVLTCGMLAGGQWLTRVRVRAGGWVMAAILLVMGFFTGLSARGLLG